MAEESKIQRRIIKKLESDGWLVVKLSLTNKNGIPDLLCLKSSRYIWIEVKAPGEKPRKLQEFRHQQLRDHGAEVHVVDSVDWIECFINKK